MDNIYYNNLLETITSSKKKSDKEIDRDKSTASNKPINYKKRRKIVLFIITIVFVVGIFNLFFISKSNLSSISSTYNKSEYLQAEYMLKTYLNKSVEIYKTTGDFREIKFPKNVKVISTKNNIVISTMVNNKCWSINNFEKNTQLTVEFSSLKC